MTQLFFTQDVTPENFLAVLAGDEEKMRGVGSGRVIKRCSLAAAADYFIENSYFKLIFFIFH